MQEHNFEKQVQHKMEELSIAPSAPVWQKVEQEIRKKKDRRRIAYWLMPLLLLSGGLAWWALQGPDTPSLVATETSRQKSEPLSSPGLAAPKTTDDKERKGKSAEKTNAAAEIAFGPAGTTANNPENSGQSKPAPALLPAEVEETSSPQHYKAIAQNQVDANQSTTPAEYATRRPALDVLPDSSLRREAVPAPSGNELPEVEKQSRDDEHTPDSLIAVNPVKRTREKKWQWDIHASAGISSVKKGLFYRNTVMQDFYQAPGPSTGGLAVTPPSEIRKGTAYSLGIALKRNLNQRLAVTGGVQYHLFSTRTTTGAQINRDTFVNNNTSFRSVSSYYQTGQQRDYTNRYHFIELPAGLEYQLFRSLPLRLHTGLVVGRLVGTNALVYDRWNNIYYKDNSVLNKTQWQVFANLNYRLVKTDKGSLHLGPYLQYGFQGLEKEAQEKKYHLFSTGLRTQVSFK